MRHPVADRTAAADRRSGRVGSDPPTGAGRPAAERIRHGPRPLRLAAPVLALAVAPVLALAALGPTDGTAPRPTPGPAARATCAVAALLLPPPALASTGRAAPPGAGDGSVATADCAAGSRPAKAPATPPPGRIPSPLPGSAGIEAGVVRISVAAEPRPNETAAIAVAVLRVRAGAGEDAVRAALAEVGATLVVPFVDAVAGSDGPAASSGTPALYPNQMRPVPAPELGRSTAAHVSTRNGVAYAELVVIDGRTIYALLGAAPGAKPATPLGDLGMVARRLLSRADSGTPPATPEAGGTAGLWEALPRPEDLPPGFVVDREWVLVGDAAGTPIPNAADE